MFTVQKIIIIICVNLLLKMIYDIQLRNNPVIKRDT